MNKQPFTHTHTDNDNYKKGDPDTPNETTSQNHDHPHYFRDNLQKQKEETKRIIEEKMKDSLKNGKNKPTFFKDKKD